MQISSLADAVLRQVEDLQTDLSEALLEPVIRLGVTGLSGAGKTVFITSLVANMLHRGRMPQLLAQSEGRILAAELRPHPDHGVARFEYETHLSKLLSPTPEWPHSTRQISTLRLTLKIKPSGMLSGVTGARIVHIDIIDYPGEWLLDLPMLSQNFADWSDAVIGAARGPARAALSEGWLAQLEASAPQDRYEESQAQSLARSFTAYLQSCRDAGLFGFAPGRFLMPGDFEGSPALTFTPLPATARARSGSLYRTFEDRFAAYKRKIVQPFFRDHFSRIDRQIVLLDALSALHSGPQALLDLRQSLQDVLSAFKPGTNSWLSSILGKRVERILFAATKADHLHHEQHPELTHLTEALVAEALRRAQFSGAQTASLSIASLRATEERETAHEGIPHGAVIGRLSETGKLAQLYAGALPKNPAHLIAHAQQGASDWLDQDYAIMRLAPPVLQLSPDSGPPHIRLDRAAQFLFGDKLV